MSTTPSAPPRVELAATAAPNCGVSVNPLSVGQAAEVGGLACLKLASGQGTELGGGLRLFQRWESSVEVWRNDEREHIGLRAIRDQRGRHWLLKRAV